MGLVVPSARSAGGFRLYTESSVARLQVIKRMKPLGFSLEESKDVLVILDALDAQESSPTETATLVARLETYLEAADARVAAVRQQLSPAEDFAADMRHLVTQHKPTS